LGADKRASNLKNAVTRVSGNLAHLTLERPRIRSKMKFSRSVTAMPYLQLDVCDHYSVADKQRLALKMSETYARMMSVDIRRISVAIRELGDGGVWRIPEPGEAPTPVAVMMLDIRKGRAPELRMEVAKALCAHCIDILGLREDRLNVEFTQHSGDEMYHPALGGYSPEWTPDEQ
jgi:phenylpyruvate tautomerase PptA (4-oxalocrotonate tautomerase family)